MQTLLHGRRIGGCERCLVELAEDRLRRAKPKEDEEPRLRFQIRKPLSKMGKIGKGAYTLRREDSRSPGPFSKEGLMGSERTSRRELLKGGAALVGGVTLGELASSQAQAHDHPMTPGSQNASPMILGSKELVEYGQRSRYVTSVRIQHPPG